MDTIQTHDSTSTKRAPSIVRIVLGLLFPLPALFCCLFQLLIPTVSTFLMSLQEVNVFGSENVYIGLENYTHFFDSKPFGQAIGFTLTTLLVRLCVVALVPVLVAWAVSQLGRRARLGLRILLTLPVALFAPVAVAVTWFLFLNPANGFYPFEGSWGSSPASARSTLLFIDALYLFGLASGLGVMVFLPLWRRPADAPRPTFREVLKPMLAAWALGLLGTIGLTLSTTTLSWVLTRGGPVGSTSTLGLLLYRFGFVNFSMGAGAAIASVILLATLVLGIAAGLLIILTRLRLDIVDTRRAVEKAGEPVSPKRSRAPAAVVLVLLALGICLFEALPFGWLIPQAFGGEGLGRLPEQISLGQAFMNTFLPPLVSATLQVLIAYLAALGIGALRPFGKGSEWLLLPFSPWLFITVLPLSLVSYLARQKAGMLDTLAGSLPPILFSIPALFILTIFFAGRASPLRREATGGESQDAPDFFKQFILPSLPLAALLWLLLLFFNGQELFWPLLVGTSPERYALHVILLQLVGTFGSAPGVLAAAITYLVLPVFVFFFLCLVPFQIFYLDRLALYTENPPIGTGKAARNPGQK